MFKCKFCGAIFGPYSKRTFFEYGEEELWGHIQMNHEEVFTKYQNFETPSMLKEIVDALEKQEMEEE